MGWLVFNSARSFFVRIGLESEGKDVKRWSWSRILALLALLDAATQTLPYDQHLLLRFIVCAVAVHTAYKAKIQEEFGWADDGNIGCTV